MINKELMDKKKIPFLLFLGSILGIIISSILKKQQRYYDYSFGGYKKKIYVDLYLLKFEYQSVLVFLVLMIGLSIYLFVYKADEDILKLAKELKIWFLGQLISVKNWFGNVSKEVAKDTKSTWKNDGKILGGFFLVVLVVVVYIVIKQRIGELGIGKVSQFEAYYIIICNWLFYVAKLGAIIYVLYFIVKKIFLRLNNKKP